VLCTNEFGAPADSRFSYTYVEGGMGGWGGHALVWMI
jgi:hypothetical protein